MAFFALWCQVKPTAIIERQPDILNVIIIVLLKFVKRNIRRYLVIQYFIWFDTSDRILGG